MDKLDKNLIISFIVLFILAFLTIFNLNSNFVPNYQKCESGIEVINECGCIPDEGLRKLVGAKDNFFAGKIELNSSLLELPNG